jgi:hypothetical protein
MPLKITKAINRMNPKAINVSMLAIINFTKAIKKHRPTATKMASIIKSLAVACIGISFSFVTRI